MTFNPYDYSSPHPEQQPNFPAIPQAPVAGFPPWTMPMEPVPGGPMAGLQDQVAGVLNAADQHHIYVPGPGGAMLQYPRGIQQSVLGDMVKGALLGFGGWLLWRHLRARKQATGQYFRRGTRAAIMWVAITIAGGVAAHILWPGSFWMATVAFTVAGFVWGQIYCRALRPASERDQRGAHRAR